MVGALVGICTYPTQKNIGPEWLLTFVRETPRKRTYAVQLRMSALGHKRTHAVQQKGSLFDHLGVSRQPELDHGTFRYAGQSPELPAVRLNDRSANG